MSGPARQMHFEISSAQSAAEIETIRTLFREYEKSLGISLCFQGFEKELAELPGQYASPRGRLLLAQSGGNAAGCIAMRPLPQGADDLCEMKRLFVRPDYRGTGIGRRLAETVIREARDAGYSRMRLDTMPSLMSTAVAMYRMLGFTEIAPYTVNPADDAIYMELRLR